MNKALKHWINNNVSFPEEWEIVFGRPPRPGNEYCPFHPNTGTPAGKVYGNIFKCFSCGRSYTVYDLLTKFNPDRIKTLAASAPSYLIIPETNNEPIKPVYNDKIIINVLRRIVNENVQHKDGERQNNQRNNPEEIQDGFDYTLEWDIPRRS
jgi:hypothetical protein